MKDPHDIRKAAIEDEIIARSEEASSKLSCFKCGDGYTPLYCLNCANDELRAKCERLEGERDEWKVSVEAVALASKEVEDDLLAVIEQCEKALQSCHWNGSEMVYNYEGVSKALAAIKKVNEGK